MPQPAMLMGKLAASMTRAEAAASLVIEMDGANACASKTYAIIVNSWIPKEMRAFRARARAVRGVN